MFQSSSFKFWKTALWPLSVLLIWLVTPKHKLPYCEAFQNLADTQSGTKQAVNEFLLSDSAFLHGLDLDINSKAYDTNNNGASSYSDFFVLGKKYQKRHKPWLTELVCTQTCVFYETHKPRWLFWTMPSALQREKRKFTLFTLGRQKSSHSLTIKGKNIRLSTEHCTAQIYIFGQSHHNLLFPTEEKKSLYNSAEYSI